MLEAEAPDQAEQTFTKIKARRMASRYAIMDYYSMAKKDDLTNRVVNQIKARRIIGTAKDFENVASAKKNTKAIRTRSNTMGWEGMSRKITKGNGTSYSISVAGNSPKKEEKAKT